MHKLQAREPYILNMPHTAYSDHTFPAYVHKVTCFAKCFRCDTSLGECELGAQLCYHNSINIRMIQEQNPHNVVSSVYSVATWTACKLTPNFYIHQNIKKLQMRISAQQSCYLYCRFRVLACSIHAALILKSGCQAEIELHLKLGLKSIIYY